MKKLFFGFATTALMLTSCGSSSEKKYTEEELQQRIALALREASLNNAQDTVLTQDSVQIADTLPVLPQPSVRNTPATTNPEPQQQEVIQKTPWPQPSAKTRAAAKRAHDGIINGSLTTDMTCEDVLALIGTPSHKESSQQKWDYWIFGDSTAYVTISFYRDTHKLLGIHDFTDINK